MAMESRAMSYKTILMHCNDQGRLERLLAPTIALADRFQSHVIGLSVVPPISVITTGVIGARPIVVDAHRERYVQEKSAMRRQFEEATAVKSFTAEWRDTDAGSFPVVDVVLEHARAADLVVASQIHREWPAREWLDVADLVAVGSGRPVLLVPHMQQPTHIGTRILLAWNGSREAARAVFDAVPILKHAEVTRLVRIDPQTDRESGLDDGICQTLLRHGVKCEKTNAISKGDVGPTLVAEAETFRADLLVMGCYGHSRLRELVFGGATRYLLEKMNVAVLMSH
jgi:nucleotide-binding universal stress UspA family protein